MKLAEHSFYYTENIVISIEIHGKTTVYGLPHLSLNELTLNDLSCWGPGFSCWGRYRVGRVCINPNLINFSDISFPLFNIFLS